MRYFVQGYIVLLLVMYSLIVLPWSNYIVIENYCRWMNVHSFVIPLAYCCMHIYMCALFFLTLFFGVYVEYRAGLSLVK